MLPINRTLALCVPIWLIASACRAPREVELPGMEETRLWIDRSVQGRRLEFYSFGKEDAETILFVAAVHGDEAAGTPLLFKLVEVLEENPELYSGRRAIIVPVANPDGYALGTRRNARDVDINRNFPASNFLESPFHGTYAASEPETRFLRQLVERFPPTGILTLHQAGEIIDFDGPATGWAYRLAEVCDKLEVRRLGGRPGSLGSWCGTDLGIRVLTIELPQDLHELEPEEAWEIYGPVFLEALK